MPLHETEAAFFYTIVCRKAAGGRFSVCISGMKRQRRQPVFRSGSSTGSGSAIPWGQDRTYF